MGGMFGNKMVVKCNADHCSVAGVERTLWLSSPAPGVLDVPTCLVCTGCGEMMVTVSSPLGGAMLELCLDCTTRFAVGVSRCPNCQSTNHRPLTPEDDDMPKITAHGGVSDVADLPAEPTPAVEPEPAVEPAAEPDTAQPDSDVPPSESSADQELFDPADHKAAEVIAYLEEKAAAGDAAEVLRVTEAERAGKARTGVLSRAVVPPPEPEASAVAY